MMKPSLVFLAIILAVAFLGLSSQVFAKNDEPVISPSVTQGSLSCFTITPGDEPQDYAKRPSCDALCGKQGAACTGVTNGALNPPTKCEDAASASFAVCRCCKASG